MKFSDGMEFNTQQAPRIVRKSDGLYVCGAGMLIPVDSYEEANQVLADIKKTLKK